VQQPVGQGGLAMVNVGDDAEVANVRGHTASWKYQRAGNNSLLGGKSSWPERLAQYT
jgi:hypothetical protein